MLLDPGVPTVQLQSGDLPGHHASGDVGEDRGDPMPATVGERELGARVGVFLRRRRAPGGHPLRSSKLEASVTHAPSRRPPSVLIAGDQHDSGTRSTTF
jgi:hypothetical protein